MSKLVYLQLIGSYKVKIIYKLNANKTKQTIESKPTSLVYCDKCCFVDSKSGITM